MVSPQVLTKVRQFFKAFFRFFINFCENKAGILEKYICIIYLYILAKHTKNIFEWKSLIRTKWPFSLKRLIFSSPFLGMGILSNLLTKNGNIFKLLFKETFFIYHTQISESFLYSFKFYWDSNFKYFFQKSIKLKNFTFWAPLKRQVINYCIFYYRLLFLKLLAFQWYQTLV